MDRIFFCDVYTGGLPKTIYFPRLNSDLVVLLRYDSDTSVCDKRISSSRKKTAVLVTSVVVPVLVVAAFFLAYFIRRAKRRSNGVHPVAL